MTRPLHPPAHPFFLETPLGERFCLYHPPGRTCRGALVHVHPFAEEMNKSRRVTAMHSRALSALGWAVLQIDLQGCGDSDGDFAHARWEHWKCDLQAACRWLAAESGHDASMWGVRLGALLALDYAAGAATAVPRILLWQPVLNGSAFLTQFLRLHVAASMFSSTSGHRSSIGDLRQQLARGQPLDIAGYRLSPQLADDIDRVHVPALPPSTRLDWIDITSGGQPEAVDLPMAWAGPINRRTVAGPAFWSAPVTIECTALVIASCDLLMQHDHAG